MSDPYRDRAALAKCAAFAAELSISCRFAYRRWISEFLPGIAVWHGGLLVNPARTKGYDDILHEMGHLAILPGCIRPYATGDVDASTRVAVTSWIDTHPFMIDNIEDPVQRALMQSGEAEAIAWGYAAQVHLDLEPRLLLAGCTEAETEIIMWELDKGRHFGVHGLQAAGMTTARSYPKMIRWVQP